jgi:hypothetical protein
MSPDALPAGPPRLAPDIDLPPYTHVPGKTPHPFSDPRGHHFGRRPERPDPPDPARWQACRPYLYGLDLFNHGYYWEAHEVWEGLWHASGRKGWTATFLKGLIQLAAAGVKVRENRPVGVRTHARRAAALFRQVAADLGNGASYFMGLGLASNIGLAEAIAGGSCVKAESAARAADMVLDAILRPEA